MFKKLKKNQGFTLVELMIVIAIIGVLAIVLIPQSSKIRNNAKNAGVETNIRVAQAQAEAIIDDSSTSATALASGIYARIQNLIVNPTTSSSVTTVETITDTTALAALSGSRAAIVYNDTAFDTQDDGDALFAAGTVQRGYLAGSVVAVIWGSSNNYHITFYGYDSSGYPISSTARAAKQTVSR